MILTFQMSPPGMFYEGNISTISFTPRDYQVELVAAAKERNIIICLTQTAAKEFCALKLIQEKSHELRNLKKISLFLTKSGTAYNQIYHLTDLKVINLNELESDEIEWESLEENQVIILETETCLDALECNYIDLNKVNLIIVDDCHRRTRKTDITEIFLKHFKNAKEKPRVLGLAGPIHNAQCVPARLGAELEYLESLMTAKAETASDIVTVLR
jgi:endoribonuclease Dicer